ncbi:MULTISPECIES: hypothetical protein [unclassified Aeromicrobium]|uniref:hypothetical protein n=1 Tax=unclassified Aeromicrobium TaxID=2633570 RepID=UPI00396B2DCC
MTTLAQEPQPPLNLGRGLRILHIELILDSGEVESFDLGQSPITFITGERNSSKTTTLKVVDFCFGNRKTAETVLGVAVARDYQAVAIEIATNGTRHRLVREFKHGLKTKVLIDGEPYELADVSEWVLSTLGWPVLQIPLGVNPATATKEHPLSFRDLLRHIYRRETSWAEFASKEEEFLRRGVVSLFLGFAPQRYESATFELGQASRTLARAEAAHREAVESTQKTVSGLTRQLNLPPVIDTSSLTRARDLLEGELRIAVETRDAITRSAESAAHRADLEAGARTDTAERLEELALEIEAGGQRLGQLRFVLAEHGRSVENVQGEIHRLLRLRDSVDVFDQLPVRVCPACEQAVDPAEHDHPGCYVCGQEVTLDLRKARADREIRALQSELEDLNEVIERTSVEVDNLSAAREIAEDTRRRLTAQLQDRRRIALAPFMAQLEDSAAEIGRLRQQLAALPALEAILARTEETSAAVAKAQAEVDRLQSISDGEAAASSNAARRCAQFADFMNEFLNQLPTDGTWIGLSVTVSSEDVAFFVGTGRWDSKLGAETKVLFFLAYSYALVRLAGLPDQQTCAPGVLLLDNPYQQGIPPAEVERALDLIGRAAQETGSQVVVTQTRPAPNLTVPYTEIRMQKVYDARRDGSA